MKKKVKKVLALFLIICCHATISHADMVSSDPFTNYLPVLIFVCIAGFLLLVSCATVLLILKLGKRKPSSYSKAYDNEKKEKVFELLLYIGSLIFAFPFIIGLWQKEIITFLFLIIIVSIFIISFILRLFGHNIMSNIVCSIGVVLVLSFFLWDVVANAKIENFNNSFRKYYVDGYRISRRINDVEGVINTAIEKNKGKRKVSVVYDEKTYSSINELQLLKDSIDKDMSYNMHLGIIDNYVDSIELEPYFYPRIKSQFVVIKDKDDYTKGDICNYLELYEDYAEYYGDETKIIFIYDNNDGKEPIRIDVIKENEDKIDDLKKSLEKDWRYRAKMKTDSNGAVNITIIKSKRNEDKKSR